MISFLLGNIKNIGIAIIAFIGVYILRKNRSLSIENQELNLSSKEKDKVINIQAKVLDVSENIKPTDLDVNLERLSDKTK
ncbi:MAG: hypothetical protein FJX70_07365 [Alphaproteobacteria bacterium]|nr:hypothetical protein [Alphaproteobacteria bacterium]